MTESSHLCLQLLAGRRQEPALHMTEWLLTRDAPGVHETSPPVSMWVPPHTWLSQPVHSDIQPAQAFGGEDALSISHLLHM